MRAAVIYEHGDGSCIRIEQNYTEPTPSAGWVKLRVRATSVNFHDIFSRRGMPGITLKLPLITGSDVAGEIVEVGDGVTGWTIGDRVLIDPDKIPENGDRLIGEQFDGGRAEYCLSHSAQLIKVPHTVSFEKAAALPLAYGTAFRLLFDRGDLQNGETVLVLGASGGVGTACVLLAKLMGCRVIACTSSEEKLERLREIGADHVINYSQIHFREAVHRLVGRPRVAGTGGVDLAVNNNGGNSWKDTIRCIRKGGRMVTCGATGGFEEEVDARYVWTFELDIRGSNGWDRRALETLLTMVAEGRLDPVIDEIYPLEQAFEAEKALEEKKVFGKLIVTP